MSNEERMVVDAAALEARWAADDRWYGIERTYSAEEVVRALRWTH